MNAKARKSDPYTSHEAADRVKDITLVQHYVLRALKKARNDSEMIEAYNNIKGAPKHSESGLRSRRAELVKQGKVIDTGKFVWMPSGRKSIVWKEAK